MPNQRYRSPDFDRRVLQIHRDLEKLNNSLRRVSQGLTFNYCYLDQIDSVIRGKEQLYSETVRTLQRLAREKLSLYRQLRASCSFANHYNNLCNNRSCGQIPDHLNTINYEMGVHRIRKNLQKQIISKLKTVRDNCAEIRPAF